MTIPEQALEAAAEAIQRKLIDLYGPPRTIHVARELVRVVLTTLPLVGVERPEDVAELVTNLRKAREFFEQPPSENMMPPPKGAFTDLLTKAADVILALPHTGQPQEGEGELEEIADGAWGDNPAIRGAARDRLRALSALPPLRAREEIETGIENATDNRKCGEASPTSHRRGAGVVVGVLDSARGIEGEHPSAPAHLSRTAGQEWRDISSAPKDGTKVILYNEKWETFPLASWEWGEGPDEDGTGGWCAWHTVDDRFPGAEDGIIYPSENHMPTHWLPAPPVAEPIVAEKSGVKS